MKKQAKDFTKEKTLVSLNVVYRECNKNVEVYLSYSLLALVHHLHHLLAPVVVHILQHKLLDFFSFFLCKMKVFNNNQQRLVVYKYFAGYQVSAMSFFVKAIKTP